MGLYPRFRKEKVFKMSNVGRRIHSLTNTFWILLCDFFFWTAMVSEGIHPQNGTVARRCFSRQHSTPCNKHMDLGCLMMRGGWGVRNEQHMGEGTWKDAKKETRRLGWIWGNKMAEMPWNELPISNLELDESRHLNVLISHNEIWNSFAHFLEDLMP